MNNFKYLSTLIIVIVFHFNIAYSQKLYNDQVLTSPQSIRNGDCRMVLENNGNLIIFKYDFNQVMWASNTFQKGRAPFRLIMQGDGNLVLYDSTNMVTWKSDTFRKGVAPFTMVLNNDGTFNIIDGTGSSTYSSSGGNQNQNQNQPRPTSKPNNTNNGGNNNNVASKLLNLVNQERAKYGLQPMYADGPLQSAAQAHSNYQAEIQQMTHNDPRGELDQRVNIYGGYYRYYAENVFAGPKTEEEAMDGWMHSQLHRDNILNPVLNRFGGALTVGRNGEYYWTQSFGQAK
ncbi:hypothetical protein PPL_11248 [Heterostelium album PN500]|uniref:Bulb-type lectin domain-containing protein n=1 Tax=Heterostelium pallidum (strain ATCC 26659 / Pp 5 / PN500) TaxID=670386 RepID=D3BTY8_HETP5|nr:hypothetical protein PPL_11248 [Heterostelium album PN500]EFA75174.1 hypothetical protein PPL_11248 [Heterostelium album PN500]|eukprot:XP_020427308.1 hypothetical protein PPL_11248 [Heterostelium album PN500]